MAVLRRFTIMIFSGIVFGCFYFAGYTLGSDAQDCYALGTLSGASVASKIAASRPMALAIGMGVFF